MKIVRFFCACLLIFTLASCAKQLPLPGSVDEGLLIVPTEGIRKASGKFVYRYQFDFNKTDNVVIDIATGKSFVPKVLKAGIYKFDYMKTFGLDKGRSRASSKKVRRTILKSPHSFEIKAGEITYFPFGVGAVIKPTSSGYVQIPNYFNLTQDVLKEFNELISGSENANRWQMP